MNDDLLRSVPYPAPAAGGSALDAQTLEAARAILADIEQRRESAVVEHAVRLGDIRPGQQIVYDRASLDAALRRITTAQRGVLERAADRIRGFASAQRRCLSDCSVAIPNGFAGHTCLPVQSVGCYVPAGRFPLPSSALMTTIPAREAGVQRICCASPRPDDVTLAAMALGGADTLLAVGGVQAVAALALGLYGLGSCDMIVGPGNRWVTAAKFLVSDRVGIDMLAGPSELVVLADHSADPRLVAADLLAQAEHDTDALPVLVTTCRDLPTRVRRELQLQLATLPTRDTAVTALRRGYTVETRDIAEALAVVDRIAPEHLEVLTERPEEVAAGVRNAGAVFVGPASAEVLGDYGLGPNHVLPTGGGARFRAGLSVFTFLRPRTWLRMDRVDDDALRDVIALARLERLEAHARAAEQRAGHRRDDAAPAAYLQADTVPHQP